MNIFKFLGWWWKKRDTGERVLIVFFSTLISVIVCSGFFGPMVFIVFLGLIVLGFILFVLTLVVVAFREQWKEYKKEREAEAERILRRLKGQS